MIVFENDGLMPLEAATTFGINAKLGENPIGFFGTGLKYAIAVTLRLGGTFRLFLGEIEYEFYLKEQDFRGKEFSMVRMKRRKGLMSRWSYEKLSFTTELGKHWEPWMAVREIESNTRDENGTSWIDHFPVNPEGICGPNKTVIIIECPEMEEAYEDLHEIFMPEKKLLFSAGPVDVYEGQSNYIFYRGLRVTDLEKPSLFTYDFNAGVTLTEDRTSKWPATDMYRIMEAILSHTDPEIIEKVMDSEENEFFESALPWDQPYVSPGTTFMALLGERAADKRALPRMLSWYTSLTVEDMPDDDLDVQLKRHEIEWLVEHLTEWGGQSEIVEKLEDAIS